MTQVGPFPFPFPMRATQLLRVIGGPSCDVNGTSYAFPGAQVLGFLNSSQWAAVTALDRYDAVVLLLGVNDAMMKWTRTYEHKFNKSFARMSYEFRSRGAYVLVIEALQLPERESSSLATLVGRVRPIMRDWAVGEGFDVLSVGTSVDPYGPYCMTDSGLFYDRVHPSVSGHTTLAGFVAQKLRGKVSWECLEKKIEKPPDDGTSEKPVCPGSFLPDRQPEIARQWAKLSGADKKKRVCFEEGCAER